MVDDADDHEQRRFEQRVRDEHRDARHGDVRVADADQHGHEAELGHRAEREDEFEVELAQRAPSAEHHRHQAEPHHGDLPTNRHREGGGETCDEVDAGLDHRGRVQVRADRGRCGHGAGQPEVERDDGRFGERADQQQDHRDVDVHTGRRCRDDLRQQVGARPLAQHDDADEHGQTAERGDQQRLGGGPPSRRAHPVEADQHEREHGRELPEHVQHQHVVGDDEAEHGRGERDHLPAEHGDAGTGVVEVVGAVAEDERTDPEDQHRQDRGQGVEAGGDVHLE